jgi:hypothetical protein
MKFLQNGSWCVLELRRHRGQATFGLPLSGRILKLPANHGRERPEFVWSSRRPLQATCRPCGRGRAGSDQAVPRSTRLATIDFFPLNADQGNRTMSALLRRANPSAMAARTPHRFRRAASSSTARISASDQARLSFGLSFGRFSFGTPTAGLVLMCPYRLPQEKSRRETVTE